jgi:hypothetical protein
VWDVHVPNSGGNLHRKTTFQTRQAKKNTTNKQKNKIENKQKNKIENKQKNKNREKKGCLKLNIFCKKICSPYYNIIVQVR